MSARSLRPVVTVATVAVAALSCYLVSLRVASERASLEDVETKIVLAQRDMRLLRTEIGTRGRLEQLERWNVKVLALSAPKADQFLDGGYQLARLARPSDEVDVNAPVVMASAPRPAAAMPTSDDDADVAANRPGPVSRGASARPPARNDGPASILHVASYSPPAPRAASVTAPGRPVAERPVKIATGDPLLPLPARAHDAKASSHPGPAAAGTKDKATH